MTKGAITPLLIRFTIPLVLGNLFQLTYNAADSIIVGKFVGEEALAAVGTSNPLMTLAILFINGMCLPKCTHLQQMISVTHRTGNGGGGHLAFHQFGISGTEGRADQNADNFNAYVVDNVVAVNTTDAQRAAQKVLRTDAIPASWYLRHRRPC